MRTSQRSRSPRDDVIAYLCGAGVVLLSLFQTFPHSWGWDETYVVLRVLFIAATVTVAGIKVRQIRREAAVTKSERAKQASS